MHSSRRGAGIAVISVLMLLAGGASPADAAEEGPLGTRVTLTDGRLFIPNGYQPEPKGPELTLHLHGAAWAAEREFVRAKQPGVLVSVVLPGLSAVYARKFGDAGVFPRILEEAAAHLAEPDTGEPPRFRRVTVTSFSAGFGGVRELLKQPDAFARIDALVMLDSIHAGFAGDPAARQVEPMHMEGFLRFAREAAEGRKTLVITHSMLRPEGYASTTETADYLLAQLGLEREGVTESWPGGLELRSRCRKGGLQVLGFTGDTGAEHMRHLHALSLFLERTRRTTDPKQD